MFSPHKLARLLCQPRVVAAVSAGLLLTWLLCWRPFSPSGPARVAGHLVLTIASAQRSSLTVRLDEGHGFAMNRPATLGTDIEPKANPTEVKVGLPAGRIRSMRLTFFGTTEVAVQEPLLLGKEGEKGERLTGRQIFGLNGSTTTSAGENTFWRNPEGGPVSVECRPKHPVIFDDGAAPPMDLVVICFVGSSALLFASGTWLQRRRALWLRRVETFQSHVFHGISRNPTLLLAGVALCSVVLSCTPVIFSGRSFVAPGNGAPLLYFGSPTLPGQPPGADEDSKGADVAAAVWQNIPYAALQHDALFVDREWPLWNRFNGGGVPLLGQGLSMFGDPLHWIPVLARSAAWAWDVKFILAKVVFALGIGLCCWSATGHLGVSALLCASSAWIGFFAFRFNHPAFFSLCYAPWLLWPWLASLRQPPGRRWLGATVLLVATIAEICSGSVKEMSMLLLCLNGTGLLLVIAQPLSWAERWRLLRLPLWACFLGVCITAPSWLLFLHALSRAANVYEVPAAFQQQPGLLLSFFDDLLSQDFTKLEQHTHPSANGLVLAGILALLAGWKRLPERRTLFAIVTVSSLALLLAYGVVPPPWITALPFVGKIQHIDNVFGCVLLILLPVLAAVGFRSLLRTSKNVDWRGEWKVYVWSLTALALLYLSFTQAIPQHEVFGFKVEPVLHSSFFLAFFPAFVASVVLLPWALRWLANGSQHRASGLLLLLVCCFVLHFRHGMYSATRLDEYVMNPQPYMDLVAQSPAIDRVKRRLAEPARTYGLGYTMAPGYQALLGLEGLCGPDPLANKPYRELCRAAGVELDLGWRVRINDAAVDVLRPVLDLLNHRFYLREGTRDKPGSLSFVGRSDLEIFESKSVWPRAFYVPGVIRYENAAQLVALARNGDSIPFAAVQGTEEPNLPFAGKTPSFVKGGEYRQTTNSMTFVIRAPGPGIAVLSENFEEGDFIATIDGKPVPYFRVNHCFKGISLPDAGTFTITFRYDPPIFHKALAIAFAGLFLLLGTVIVLLKRSNSLDDSPSKASRSATVALC